MFKSFLAISAFAATALSALQAANPIITNVFTADPAAIVSGGRVYLYTGHDETAAGATGFVMRDWRVYSSTNMVNWTDHGSRLNVTNFALQLHGPTQGG